MFAWMFHHFILKVEKKIGLLPLSQTPGEDTFLSSEIYEILE